MTERLFQTPVLKVKLLSENATLPHFAHPGDAGFDLFSPVSGEINPGQRQIIPLRIMGEFPENWAVFLKDKSSLGARGIHVLGGVIDSSYRGEWKVVLLNTGEEIFKFDKGQKIVQGVLVFAPQAKIVKVDKLSETQRGKGGFGSTGEK